MPPILTGSLPGFWSSPFPPGGSTGSVLYGIAKERLNPGGAFLLFSTILLLGIVVLSLERLHALEVQLRERWSSRKKALEDTPHPHALSAPLKDFPESPSFPGPAFDTLSLSPRDPTYGRASLPPGEDIEEENLSFPAIGLGGDAVRFRPPESLLDPLPTLSEMTSPQFLKETERSLSDFFQTYGVPGRMMGHQTGPVVTLFEFQPAPGIKVNRVTGLANELSLVLKVPHIHIQVPVPGKSAEAATG